MNYRQIETSREIRLWVTGIIAPVILGTATVLASNPELMKGTKKYVQSKLEQWKRSK